MPISSTGWSSFTPRFAPAVSQARRDLASALVGHGEALRRPDESQRAARSAANVRTLITNGVALALGRFIDLHV